MSEVLWRRLGYMLSPQLDIYRYIAPMTEGLHVVDIGFGTGFGTLQAMRYARFVDGIELDREAVRFAQDCMPGVRWNWGDISRGVSYIAKDVDMVLMIEVLEHVKDWQAALTNVVDILRPGGKLVISGRNALADLRKNELHEREWTALEFVSALDDYFEEVKLYDYTLQSELDVTTRSTPLVAICRKE